MRNCDLQYHVCSRWAAALFRPGTVQHEQARRRIRLSEFDGVEAEIFNNLKGRQIPEHPNCARAAVPPLLLSIVGVSSLPASCAPGPLAYAVRCSCRREAL